MARRTRILMVCIGLLLVGISAAALVYAFSSPGLLHASAPVAPTLFALPPVGSP